MLIPGFYISIHPSIYLSYTRRRDIVQISIRNDINKGNYLTIRSRINDSFFLRFFEKLKNFFRSSLLLFNFVQSNTVMNLLYSSKEIALLASPFVPLPLHEMRLNRSNLIFPYEICVTWLVVTIFSLIAIKSIILRFIKPIYTVNFDTDEARNNFKKRRRKKKDFCYSYLLFFFSKRYLRVLTIRFYRQFSLFNSSRRR